MTKTNEPEELAALVRSAVADAIAPLAQKMDGIEKRFEVVGYRLQGMGNALEQTMREMLERVARVEDRITAMNDNVAALNGRMATISVDFADVKGRLERIGFDAQRNHTIAIQRIEAVERRVSDLEAFFKAPH